MTIAAITAELASVRVYQTCNPSLWEATWTAKANGVVRMVNGEGATREEALAALKARLPAEALA